MASFLILFRPTIDAIFSTLPWTYRWRLLAFQPLNFVIHLLNLPWIISNRHKSLTIPVRDGRTVRAIVYNPPHQLQAQKLRPLHLDIHAGGFVGGFPEANARFCSTLSDETGAVVVSCSYRFAPRHPFPAATDDVDDVVKWLLENAESELQADAQLFTVGGASAGGNLALSTCQHPNFGRTIKGCVTFYAPVDLRIPPNEKPRSGGLPSFDPMSWMFPLFHSYAHLAMKPSEHDPRLHPILADVRTLPKDLLLIIPTLDILVHEQLTLVERLKKDIEDMGEAGKSRQVEALIFDHCFHGWLELPSFAIKEHTRQAVFNASCKFIAEIHRKHGFNLESVQI